VPTHATLQPSRIIKRLAELVEQEVPVIPSAARDL